MNPAPPSSPTFGRQQSFGACSRQLVVAGTTVRDTLLPRATALPRHRHLEPYLCIVLDGSYTETAHGEIRCEPGSLVAHPGGHEHANWTGPTGARCVNVEFSDALRSDPALRALSGREQVLRLPPLHPALCRLRFALTLQDISAALSTLAATLEVVCAATSAPAAGKGQRWLRGVVDQIEADLMHDHSLQELAKRAGVHVSQLVRSFKRDHGESIGGYLRRRRLEVANARLSAEDTPLAEIALDAGFCDQSHFTRAYARQFGSTPGQRRRLLRS